MEEKLCALCRKPSKMTYEHIPPQCAFNNKLIFVQRYEHFGDETSQLYGKKMRSNRGFGKHCLCASCNSSTGNWYVKDFCKFTEQALEILNNCKTIPFVRGVYQIKPQTVLKQILMMFVAADSSGVLISKAGVAHYLLNRESAAFPNKIKIFLYSNQSTHKRMLGYCFVGDLVTGRVSQWSELNFKPFGYFLCYDSEPPNEAMIDITTWNEQTFNQIKVVEMTTALLSVSSMIIGQYDNIK